MSASTSLAASQYQALYRSTVEDVAAGGGLMMGKLVAAARATLQSREAACRDLRLRDALVQSAKHLRSWEPELCKRFPKLLLEAFENPLISRKAGNQAVDEVAFDELELMDEVQVLTSVALARTQQVAMLAAEASLTELNTLICTTLGLGAVDPERNPLRPQVYIHALRSLIEQTQLPSDVQLDWLSAMSATLGNELRTMYVQLADSLRSKGVMPAGYAVVKTFAGNGIGRGVAQETGVVSVAAAASERLPVDGDGGARHAVGVSASAKDASLLTLDKLHSLLAGAFAETAQLSAREQFARRFEQEFERNAATNPDELNTDFDSTVPAALEALTDMKQVDDVVQRLQRRQAAVSVPILAGDTSVEAVRGHLRASAKGIGQLLSLEVITMMVENIAQDARLLPAVQQLIRRLEPALLRLALVDPRIFTNKQHPARVLIQEIAHRSLAYLSVHAYGFSEFMRGAEEAISNLLNESIEDAEPFELALNHLSLVWERAAKASERSRAEAMVALQNAEQRNLLAEKIARKIEKHADAAQVPDVVIHFLCGPWAQVVAQARLSGLSAAPAAEKYQSLIAALLWSVQPVLSANDVPKLTRVVPRLLSTLREGLETIHYPATRTSVFLEALMGLHQKAFRSAQKPKIEVSVPVVSVVASARPNLLEDGNPWIAPEEARASNFMDLQEMPDVADARAVPSQPGVPVTPGVLADPGFTDSGNVDELAVGSWIELLVNGVWTRTQLSWASPHGTLFLFTNAAGTTQSITRRSRDRLMNAGQLRVISGRPMVDGAFDAVAQTALRNSVNRPL